MGSFGFVESLSMVSDNEENFGIWGQKKYFENCKHGTVSQVNYSAPEQESQLCSF